MAEHAHETHAASIPARIPYAPSLAEPAMSVALHSAILTACERLEAATAEYAAASGLLAEAVVAESEARLTLEYAEINFRAGAFNDGIPGSNEAQRAAHLAFRMADDPDIDHLRSARDAAHNARVVAEHHHRTTDAAQKSLRARLAALTALLRAA